MPDNHTTGCFICGKPLVYESYASQQTCVICGCSFESEARCEAGHFVCNSCHASGGIAAARYVAISAASKNPVLLAVQMMHSPAVNMHGPEHHFLVPAALLAAYHNAGGKIDLAACIDIAKQRAKNVPGGICGNWGTCGAAVGAGIFISIVTGASPLAVESWSMANLAASRCLAVIAKHGGPRCCKRNSFLAISEAALLCGEKLGVEMELPESVACGFRQGNKECIKGRCPFYR